MEDILSNKEKETKDGDCRVLYKEEEVKVCCRLDWRQKRKNPCEVKSKMVGYKKSSGGMTV